MAKAYPRSSGHEVRTHPGQDVLYYRVCNTLSPSLPLSESMTIGHANSSNVHISGMWEETRVLGENPHIWREHANSIHRLWPQPGIDFSLQRYNKMTLNEMMLSKDLLTVIKTLASITRIWF